MPLLRAFLHLVVAVSLIFWGSGGLQWGDRVLFAHAPDVKRVGIVALAGLILLSVFCRTCRESDSRWGWIPLLRWIDQKLATPEARRVVLGVAALCAALLGTLQMLALRTRLYDVGIFHQQLWSLSEGLGFWCSISGAGNALHDHFAPSVALLLPLFTALGRSAWALAWIHPLLIFGGVWAWVRLAEKRAPQVATAVLFFGLAFEHLWGNLSWGFHENSIAFFSLSWAIALGAESDDRRRARSWAVALFLMVGGLSKETLLLSTPFLAWALLGRRAGLVFLVAMFATFLAFELQPKPADKNYFVRYYSYLGASLPEAASFVLFHPLAAVSAFLANVGFRGVGTFFVHVFGPFLLVLPFLGVRQLGRERAIGAGISVAMTYLAFQLSARRELRDPSFHYMLELWPVLAWFTIEAWRWIGRRWPARVRLIAVGWVLAVAAMSNYDPLQAGRQLLETARDPQVIAARLKMAKLPPQDSVMAEELAGPWVASRRIVTRQQQWIEFYPGRCPDWVVSQDLAPLGAMLDDFKARCGTMTSEVVGRWTFFHFTGSPGKV